MTLSDLVDALRMQFMQNMFMAVILASVACGIIGAYVVSKRLVFISDGIGHTAFGGIGMGYYLGINPLFGAVAFSLGTAVAVGIAGLRSRIREDSTIGILWVMGMALGVLFIKETPGYVPDPMDILFGNILFVKRTDIYIMALLVVVIVLVVAALYKELLALSFDEEYAKIAGVRTGALNIVLLILIALTVVTLLKVVGVILVIALLTIPAAMAGLFTHEMRRMMALATVFGLVFSIMGTLVSWETDMPPGVVIVLMLGLAFVCALVLKRGVSAVSSRRKRGRAGDKEVAT